MADPGKPADMSWLPDAKVKEALGKQLQAEQIDGANFRESKKFNGGEKGSKLEAAWAAMDAVLGVVNGPSQSGPRR
jgi:hypothetical protein